MRKYLPGRYFLLALIAGPVSVMAAGMATDSQAVMALFAFPGSALLGWLASAADMEERRHG
jgi:hypothetical protein